MSLALFFAVQHVPYASTLVFRSLRLCVGILLWLGVCWCYGVVRLGWCGILMQAKSVFQPACSCGQRTEGWTERHDEANSSFSQFRESV